MKSISKTQVLKFVALIQDYIYKEGYHCWAVKIYVNLTSCDSLMMNDLVNDASGNLSFPLNEVSDVERNFGACIRCNLPNVIDTFQMICSNLLKCISVNQIYIRKERMLLISSQHWMPFLLLWRDLLCSVHWIKYVAFRDVSEHNASSIWRRL